MRTVRSLVTLVMFTASALLLAGCDLSDVFTPAMPLQQQVYLRETLPDPYAPTTTPALAQPEAVLFTPQPLDDGYLLTGANSGPELVKFLTVNAARQGVYMFYRVKKDRELGTLNVAFFGADGTITVKEYPRAAEDADLQALRAKAVNPALASAEKAEAVTLYVNHVMAQVVCDDSALVPRTIFHPARVEVLTKLAAATP